MLKRLVLLATALAVSGAHAEKLNSIKTSGLIFKDPLETWVFDDPAIKGISCYITLPKRSMSFEDQTDSSISCRKVGKVSGTIKSKRKIFPKKKSWFIKSLYVGRIYDKKRNVIIYLSYTKKMSGDNANNSISVVVL